MKEDIQFHKGINVQVAAVYEWDEAFTSRQWTIYLLNQRSQPIQTVLVMSRGYNEEQKTSTLRHSLGDLLPQTATKIEFVTNDVLGFSNEYLITFFMDNKMFESRHVFPPFSLDQEKTELLPIIDVDGVLAR